MVVQGGRTKDFSEKSRQQLTSVVEIFDPYSELWEQRQVTGDAPSPGTYFSPSASLHDDLFSFGGWDGRGSFFNTLHRLDTKTWRWCQLSPQNAEGAPMPKAGCGMISFRDSLGVFGGYGIPRGPTEPQSEYQLKGWTNEFHIYQLKEGIMYFMAIHRAFYMYVHVHVHVLLFCKRGVFPISTHLSSYMYIQMYMYNKLYCTWSSLYYIKYYRT